MVPPFRYMMATGPLKVRSLVRRIVALSPSTIRRAQGLVLSCEFCSPDAELPFDWILDRVTGCDGASTEYLMPETAHCPRCGHAVTEKTLVECDDEDDED